MRGRIAPKLRAELRAEILRGRTPPEVESIAQRRGDLLRSLRKQPDELWSDALPAVQLTPAGAVDEFDCLVGRGPGAREAAREAAWASVEAGRPPLFRGVGAHWPAVQEWTVETLRAQLRRAADSHQRRTAGTAAMRITELAARQNFNDG